MKKMSRARWWGIPFAACLLFVPELAHAQQDASAAPGIQSGTRSKPDARRKSRGRTAEIEEPTTEIDGLLEDVARLEERFTKLRTDYGNPDQPFPQDEIRKQYEEATYLYLVEDYNNAALLFYAVLDKADRVSFPEYEDAEVYLAESLEFGRNLYPALEYFTRIVEYGPSHRYYDLAVVNMVELYARTGNFEKFQRYYESYIQRNQGIRPTDSILYALGKTFFAQQSYDKALEIFKELTATEGRFLHLARYFVGSVHVVRRQFPEAIAAFQELVKLSVNTPEQREVEELAYLALGRIYLETGEYAKAQEAYQNISRDSRYFADALYEEAWTYIKQENFEQAIRSIDILLLTFPDNVNVPGLKRIRGVLQQKRQNYDEALDTYQKLVAEYTGIKEELDRIMNQQTDILTYFNELIGNDLNRLESSFLVPSLAVRFATAEQEVSRVMGVARELKVQQRDLEEAFRLLHNLEKEVYGSSPRNLLVGMRRARAALATLQNQVLLAKEQIIRAEQIYVTQQDTGAARQKVLATMESQETAGRLARQLPERRRELGEMLGVYEDQVQEIQRNVFKLEATIEEQLAQAAAIEKYTTYSRESGVITPDVEQRTRFNLASERDQLDALLNELSSVNRELKEFDVKRYLRQNHSEEEEAFRRDADATLAGIRRDLLGIRGQIKADPSFTRKVDDGYERLERLGRELGSFERELDSIELVQVANVKKAIEFEKEELNQSGLLAQNYEGDTNGLADKIARRSFVRIHRHFSDLILQADFGITDVYWELKEEKSREIDSTLEQRGNDINLLQQRFQSLQSGDL